MLSYVDVNTIIYLYYDRDKTKTQIKEFLGFAKSCINHYPSWNKRNYSFWSHKKSYSGLDSTAT